jgi:hypothetical protein
MTNERKPEDLTEDELAEVNGEPLPDREQLTVIHGAEPLPVPIVPDAGDVEWSNDPVPPGT